MINKQIVVEKLYKYDLEKEYISVAVPFKAGELLKEQVPSLMVVDSDKKVVPTMITVTADWPDGSAKYLFIRFLGNLPANKNVIFNLIETNDKPDFNPISAVMTDEGVSVDNGVVSFTANNGGTSIFSKLIAGKKEYIGEQFVGPVLKVGGTELGITVDAWEVVSCGTVCAIIEGNGKYSDDYSIKVRLTVYAGKEYIDVSFRLFNDTEEDLIPDSWNFYIKREAGLEVDSSLIISTSGNQDSTGCGDMNESASDASSLKYSTTGTGKLAEIENEIRLGSKSGIRTMTGVSNYKTRFEISGEGESLCNIIDAKMLIGEANEHFAEVLYGTFMADVTDAAGGVCATIYQAHQNFPKAIKASSEGLCVYLIPEGNEKVNFSYGMAREQRVQLHFHSNAETLEELDNRGLIYQMPVGAFVSPEMFAEAKVFPNIVTDPAMAKGDVELSMISKADTHGRAYGMMNWGDFPDSNYTAQGRGGGRLVWTNNEYDYPHAQFMMYARTGIRRFLDYATVSARHWMDVDICHFSNDPLRIGGQWEHTACHNGGNFSKTGVKGVMVCSHEWVEGMLDLYHFTGDDRAYATAIGIGENILRLLDTPMYQKPGEANARETGWALRTLTALYIETHEERWIEKCNWIIDQFKAWKDKYGAWLAPYTDNTVIRVGFMISVAVGSLMRYYREFQDDELKSLILSAVDDLIETELNPYGLFYYKDLPSLARNGQNTLLLESMYIGYELTGDTKYLKAGLGTFWVNIREPFKYDSGKRAVEDAVLVGTVSPKGFGQSFLPLIQFYNAALHENLL